MPALKPLPSLARVVANQQNAQRSTGPTTEAGKARTRQNALKHGLTGDGIAVPGEDQAALAERFAGLTAELAPTTTLGAYFVARVALMTVRTQRAARQESRAIAHRVRHAAEAHDQARRDAAQLLADQLGTDPVATHRDLVRTPEGVDQLTDALLDLRASLNRPIPLWSDTHEAQYEACHGRRVGDRTTTRGLTLSLALRSGQTRWLTPADQALAQRAADLKIWLAQNLIAAIDAEIARLAAHRATLDHATIALDRAEAADRALFDPSREATLARRYEAAATRELHRSLAEWRQAEAQAEAQPQAGAGTHTGEGAEGSASAIPEAAALPPAAPVVPPLTPPPALPDPAVTPVLEPIKEAATIAPKVSSDADFKAALALFGRDCLDEAGAASTAVPTSDLPPGPGGDQQDGRSADLPNERVPFGSSPLVVGSLPGDHRAASGLLPIFAGGGPARGAQKTRRSGFGSR